LKISYYDAIFVNPNRKDVTPVMRMLLVNNFLDQVKYASSIDTLHRAISDQLEVSIEMIPYTDFVPEFVETHIDNIDAVVLSGTEAMLSKDSVQSAFKRTIEAVSLLHLPVLGICGGHQLIAQAYGERVLYIGRLLEGYREVEVLVEDPIFHGLPTTFSVTQSHEEMVEHVPRGFTLLARSAETPIEAVRSNESGVLYGVQFHPEFHDENHPAGKLILANFAKIVKR